MDLHRCSKCCHISLCNFNNSPSLIALLVSWETSVLESCQTHCSIYKFCNIQVFFLLKAWILSLGTNIVNCFPSSLCSFSRTHWPNTQVWINVVCLFFHLLFSSKNCGYKTKADNSAGNSNNHSSAYSTKALCVLPILSFKITKKTSTRGSIFGIEM